MAMDRIVELVQLLEPEVAPPPPDLQARQRDVLLQFIASADKARTRLPRWRPKARHSGWYIAIAGAAAVAAVVAAISLPGSSPPHPPVAAPGTSAVLTAVTRALANVSSDIEEVRSSAPVAVQPSSVSWIDLATGACRTDTSVDGQPLLTVFVKSGSAVFIDYGLREWWTRGTGGVTCEPLTPETIEHDLSTGNYTLAGRALCRRTAGAQACVHDQHRRTPSSDEDDDLVGQLDELPTDSVRIGRTFQRANRLRLDVRYIYQCVDAQHSRFLLASIRLRGHPAQHRQGRSPDAQFRRRTSAEIRPRSMHRRTYRRLSMPES